MKLPKVQLICRFCSTPFFIHQCFAKVQKYCSRICTGLAHRGRPSGALGKHWTHGPEYREKKRQEVIARLALHPAPKGEENPNWRGGLTPVHKQRLLTPEWKALKASILSRDAHACQCCGSQDNLHVHHLIPWRMGGEDAPSNLYTVCNHCHGKVEREYYQFIGPMQDRCLACCGGDHNEVLACPANWCPLWPYRSGHNPAREGLGKPENAHSLNDSENETA